jgi:hypothetical protein
MLYWPVSMFAIRRSEANNGRPLQGYFDPRLVFLGMETRASVYDDRIGHFTPGGRNRPAGAVDCVFGPNVF